MTATDGPQIKTRPLPDERLREITERHGTPLYVYDLETVRTRVSELAGFDVVRYAQKANSNVHLLRRLRSMGVVVDAVSAGEIQRALLAGFEESEIHFTADIFDRAALRLLQKHPTMHVNLGSPDMVEQYAALGAGQDVTLRINPGFGHGHDLKVSTGGQGSKHGIWYDQLPQALARAQRVGLHVTGLHMHIGSGSDFEHLSRIRQSMERAALTVGESLKSISTGGGLPVPYRPGEAAFAVGTYLDDWRETKRVIEEALGHNVRLEVEPGRFLVAECGLLLTEVRAVKDNDGLEYILVDAGFDSLVRPAMYGAYHHVSILGRDSEATQTRVVAGPLCESADMFTQTKGGHVAPRDLPSAQVGDLLCIHDVGAYASSMASNYNSRFIAAEVLVEENEARLIRRRQTFDDLVATELGLDAKGADGPL